MRAVPPPSTQSGTGCPLDRKRSQPVIVLSSMSSQWDKIALQIQILLARLGLHDHVRFGKLGLGDTVTGSKTQNQVRRHVGEERRNVDWPRAKFRPRNTVLERCRANVPLERCVDRGQNKLVNGRDASGRTSL